MFKYLIGQEIHFMHKNKHHSAPILSRICVDNNEVNACTDAQKQFWHRFGEARIMYSTCHGEHNESEIFPSKEEMLKSL